ncbi:MAG TPA: cytidine deaminase [Solirubrobacteraceae bacterium]|nr:cytidine deaminase [Solirubrobacteraceae bacterium]
MPNSGSPLIDANTLSKLRDAAKAALPRCYPRYSGFVVLAAVKTASGDIYGGANVEVANLSLTKHAEEAAVMAAITDGAPLDGGPWLEALYVIGGAPCGSCRQFLWEFATEDAVVVIDDTFGHVKSSLFLRDLLPEAFGPADMKTDLRPGTPPPGVL